MARAHYIVRVGNDGLAAKVTSQAPNHWHYLSPQHIWGLPRDMTHVKVRAAFEADIESPHVTAYIWFLCNGHGGPGHFVQVGIGQRHIGSGPVGNGALPIPADMMARLQQGFDHWFGWRPVSPRAAFRDQVRQLPIPHPPYIPTLRRVTGEHPSFPLFQNLVDSEEQRQQQAAATATAAPPAPVPQAPVPPTFVPQAHIPPPPSSSPPPPIPPADLDNLRREQTSPHSPGHLYLIHMSGTTFYKIGMSLDPEMRLRTLQTGNPLPLSLLSTHDVQDMRSAEMSVHQRFENQRVPNASVREWFEFSDGAGEVEREFERLG
ncbi:hypothetical protein MMC20_006136 [Loxospora ochrophaea]|nr:hypothetical protein [Loxospora ochrophaea]